ncbi:hypothetical protein ACHAQJ_000167 [Trichoderma viride]
MAYIARSRKTGIRQRDLEKIVSFPDVSVAPDDESDADEEVATREMWPTEVSPNIAILRNKTPLDRATEFTSQSGNTSRPILSWRMTADSTRITAMEGSVGETALQEAPAGQPAVLKLATIHTQSRRYAKRYQIRQISSS